MYGIYFDNRSFVFLDIKLRFLGEAYVCYYISNGREGRTCESGEEYFDNTFSVISIGNFVIFLTTIEIRNNKIKVVVRAIFLKLYHFLL